MCRIEIPTPKTTQKEFDLKEENLGILRKFCAPGSGGKYLLNHPFIVGDFAYACDTKIIVRMPKEFVPEHFIRPDGTPPNVEDVISEDELLYANYSLPIMISSDITTTCGQCEGTGGLSDFSNTPMCPDCGGEGVVTCHSCDSTHSCSRCNGRGVLINKSQCAFCQGSGREHAFMIDDIQFSLHYARRVQDLFGSVEWGLSLNRERAMFRAGKIDGCYMRVFLPE